MNDNLADQEEVWEELLDGRVVAMSPRPSVPHNQVAFNIASIFSAYLRGKRCRTFADGVDLYLTEKDRFVPDYLLEKMKEEEKAAVVTQFQCSLFDDLTIRLEDVFERVE